MKIKKITKNFYSLFILLFLASMLVYPASNPAESNKGNAEIVYRLPLKNFFPEGMAYDPVDKCFYIGSHVDGLYYYNGGILAVQHQRVKSKPLVRIARTYLDKEYLQGTKLIVLEADHPAFRLPTTGAIVKDEFYFIATSFIDKWRKKQPVVDPVLIMKVSLAHFGLKRKKF
jgi:hypothetical protein